ncbi:unnamed protein product [Staurois parvus]|uniref:Uncharacterized protein n=1 Tax=Staurois parvus TaxID=386267 RepID=A0ABN9FGZ9_9NEOB|nr:unnamed protein product [Staurois parvus]
MRGPGRADIVNAGSGESGYSECGSGYSGRNNALLVSVGEIVPYYWCQWGE